MEHGYDIAWQAIYHSVNNLSWTLLGNFGWRCPLRSSLRVEEFDKTAEEEHSASRLTWRDFIVLSDQHSFSESTRAVVVCMALDKRNALLRDIEGFLPAWVLENKTNLTMDHVCRLTSTLTDVQKLQDGWFFFQAFDCFESTWGTEQSVNWKKKLGHGAWALVRRQPRQSSSKWRKWLLYEPCIPHWKGFGGGVSFGTKDGGISWYQTAWRIKYKVDEQWLHCHADTDMRQSTNISRPWGVKSDPLRIRFQNSSHLRR